MLGYVKYKQPYVTGTRQTGRCGERYKLARRYPDSARLISAKSSAMDAGLPKVDRPDTPTVNKVHSNGPYGFTAPPTAGTYPGHDQTPKRKPWWSAIFVFAFYVLLFVGGGAALIFAWPVVLSALVIGLMLGIIFYLWYLASLGLAVARFTRWLNWVRSVLQSYPSNKRR